MVRPTASVVSCLFLAAVCGAQSPPAFEVASIRPSADQPERANVGVRISGSQVRISYFSLRDYVSYATGTRPAQIVAPDWMAQARFDIAAKLPDGASATQAPAMLQQLLADRFELKMHHASQEFDVYSLTVTKDGPKVDAIADTGDAPTRTGTVEVAASGGADGVYIDLGAGSSFGLAGNRLDLRKVTTAQIAEGLTRFMDRPVTDAARLPGRYSLAIDLAPPDYAGTLVRSALNAGVVLPPQALRALDYASRDPFSPTFQKYGLTLQPGKAHLDVVVVDSMRKTPIDN
jgi:uncharacterized protein (TIGR03435 family)